MKKKVITIDGPAGAGKSTISKALADKLKYLYLDTGALYRALAYKALKQNIALNDSAALAAFCSVTDVTLNNVDGRMTVYVDGEDVGDKIRTEEVGLAASALSAFSVVREKLLSLQRDAGLQGGIVAEGRDMGSVVFPNADYKFYLDADIQERTRRRHSELHQKSSPVAMEGILKDMKARDHQDSQRAIAPLKPSPDAFVIDSTSLDVSEVVDLILRRIAGHGRGERK